MNHKEIKKRIEKLKEVINYHRYSYHVLEKQEISEEILDSLKHELYCLEQQYPEFITPDSPTQRVEGKPLEKFQKAKHEIPMLSTEDLFNKKELKDWEDYLKKIISTQFEYFIEPKIDGFAVSLEYRKGIFYRGSTRGDGLTGEDITQNLKTIESIPLKLQMGFSNAAGVPAASVTALARAVTVPSINLELTKTKEKLFLKTLLKNIQEKEIEIRGEVYMDKKDFEKFNLERKKKGELTYSNPRNLAAGSIRQLDSKIVAKRPLKFLAYDLVTDLNQKTHSEEHQILSLLGFKVNTGKKCFSLEEIVEYWEKTAQKRESLPFQIDGIIISVNDNKLFQRLGVIGKSSRGMRAFKFSAKQNITQVLDIVFQVGRTGTITPIAYLKPVQIGGVTITKATLHNEEQMRKLGIKIHDTIIIERAGDVIPAVIKVLPELRTGQEKEIKMPTLCPICKTRLIKPEKTIWKCSNLSCEGRQRRYFFHFISKKGFDIEGLGPQIINQLYDQGLITDPTDLFLLKEEILIPLKRFDKKSAQNLIKAIQEKKEIPLAKFIYALGIEGIGEKMAQILANYFSNFENFQKAEIKDFQFIKDIGPKIINSISSFFQNPQKINFIKKINKMGIKIINPSFSKKNLKFQNKIFVFTGTLTNLTREKAKEKILQLGANISEDVSFKTNFVVVGKNPGSKLIKAQKLGIKILTQKEFLKILKD